MADSVGKPLRILSFDGGGVRGYLSLLILRDIVEQICAHRGTDVNDYSLHDDFHLFAGTSTGGLIAAGLALNGSFQQIEKLIELYRNRSRQIFPRKHRRVLRLLWGAMFGDDALRKSIREVVGDAKLDQLPRPIFVPTYRLNYEIPGKGAITWNPREAAEHLANGQVPSLEEVCLSTSAAPTYLPVSRIKTSYESEKYDYFLDGGIFMNSPHLGSVLEVVQNIEYYSRNANIEQNTDFGHALIVLSIGTGRTQPQEDEVVRLAKKPTLYNWIFRKWLITSFMDASAEHTHLLFSDVVNITRKTNFCPIYPTRIDLVIDNPDYSSFVDSRKEVFEYLDSIFESKYRNDVNPISGTYYTVEVNDLIKNHF